MMKRQYGRIIEVAEAYEVIVTIEVHGYFTTKPEFLERMLAFVDSPFLRLNFDTGNSFIAGQDPVVFCKRFRDKVAHVHVKDVSESLAAIARGGQTGIALSHCAVGEGGATRRTSGISSRYCMKGDTPGTFPSSAKARVVHSSPARCNGCAAPLPNSASLRKNPEQPINQ